MTIWNKSGYAGETITNNHNVSDSVPYESQITLNGSASNPLENPLAAIAWNMLVAPIGYPNSPSVTVNYQHTCYPAHIIKVNGTVVYSYQPPRNDPGYLFQCLVLGVGGISGSTAAIPVPSN
jgi:hypothetical protein